MKACTEKARKSYDFKYKYEIWPLMHKNQLISCQGFKKIPLAYVILKIAYVILKIKHAK